MNATLPDRLLLLITTAILLLSGGACRQSVISKEQIKARLGDSQFVLLDTRTDEEYLGWQLHGDARGGHLPDAIHFPATWFYTKDGMLRYSTELLPMLQERGITPDKDLVTYSSNDKQSASVCSILRELGYPRCHTYEGGVKEWAKASATDYPLEKAARYESVVSPAWVNHRIESRDKKSLVILEADWAEMDCAVEYQQGHLPGALYLSTDLLENGYPRWHLRPVSELQNVVGDFGIARNTTVIIYSRQLIAAARVWWVLKYLGVEDVRLLNGGYDRWIAEGYQKETIINRPIPTKFEASVQEQYLTTTAQVQAACQKQNVWLADARALEEFAGKISGYDYLAMKGRIPGAINVGNADDSSWLYKDRDGTIRSYTEISAMWRQQGIDSLETADSSGSEIIFYCGSGWRSSLTFFYAYVMGYQNIRNYSDGWSGWSTTYRPDPGCKGITPGWRQEPSGNPVIVESGSSLMQ